MTCSNEAYVRPKNRHCRLSSFRAPIWLKQIEKPAAGRTPGVGAAHASDFGEPFDFASTLHVAFFGTQAETLP
jgi:hypothetical protein